MKNILLIRHGESEWNKKNLFTGFKDVPLSENGIMEAKKAGEQILNSGLSFDLVYTSLLQRAQNTANIIIECIGQKSELTENNKIIKHKDLNERDYGDLTGLNKKETADKYGNDQVHKWRRGYSDRPPGGESLEDVVKRVSYYFDKTIFPSIKSQEIQNILIAAHGNSLRALLIVTNIYSKEKISEVELSTGVPIHLTFDKDIFALKV